MQAATGICMGSRHVVHMTIIAQRLPGTTVTVRAPAPAHLLRSFSTPETAPVADPMCPHTQPDDVPTQGVSAGAPGGHYASLIKAVPFRTWLGAWLCRYATTCSLVTHRMLTTALLVFLDYTSSALSACMLSPPMLLAACRPVFGRRAPHVASGNCQLSTAGVPSQPTSTPPAPVRADEQRPPCQPTPHAAFGTLHPRSISPQHTLTVARPHLTPPHLMSSTSQTPLPSKDGNLNSFIDINNGVEWNAPSVTPQDSKPADYSGMLCTLVPDALPTCPANGG